MNMEKQQDPFHPLGICQKLFKFITSLFSSHSAQHQTVHDSCKDDSPGSDVHVHFKQSEDSLHNPDSSSLFLTESAEPITSQTQVRSRRRASDPATKKHTAKSGVNIEQQSEEIKKEDAKGTVPIDTERPKLKYQPRLISVAPNINEKSESFIKSRIEAMRRNLGLDPHES